MDPGLVTRPAGDVGPTDLTALYRDLLAGDEQHRKLSPRSVAYIAAILHRSFRDAVRWQAITRNPADASHPPRPGAKTEMRTWTAAQLRAFLDSVSGDHLSGCWWLLATTGMRRGEALGLRWADVDFERQLIRITRTLITTDVQRKDSPGFAWGTPKTVKGRRTIALDDAVAALKAHRKRQREERLALGADYQDEDLVICQADGTPIHPKTISYQFGKAARAAALPKSAFTIFATPTPPWRSSPGCTHASCRSGWGTPTCPSPSTRTRTSTSTCRPQQPPE